MSLSEVGETSEHDADRVPALLPGSLNDTIGTGFNSLASPD